MFNLMRIQFGHDHLILCTNLWPRSFDHDHADSIWPRSFNLTQIQFGHYRLMVPIFSIFNSTVLV